MIQEKLDELVNLPPNWDSYGGLPAIPPCALAAAKLFSGIMQAPKMPFIMPEIVPTNRGTIMLEWHFRGVDLEIDVLGTDRFHVCAEEDGIVDEFDATTDLTEIVRWYAKMGPRT